MREIYNSEKLLRNIGIFLVIISIVLTYLLVAYPSEIVIKRAISTLIFIVGFIFIIKSVKLSKSKKNK